MLNWYNRQPASTGTSSKKRRRIRPLLTEGRKKAVVVRRPKGTPTDAEWAKLDCLEAFVVEDDSENHAHTKFVMFRKGDDAIVNSQDNAGGNVWVGRIAQIRKRPDGQVWVKIFWYFSGNDTSPYVKSFHAEDCSPMERLVSDNYDLQQSDCFIAVTYMHEYCEADLDPPDLEPHQFFVRTKLYFKKLTVQPQLGLKTCICHRAYVLFPSPTAGGAITDDNKPSPYDADVMHFCPRPSCRRWYHVSCLQAQYFVDQTPYQYRGDRGVRRLAVNPDEDFPCPLLAWFCEPIDSDETTAIHPSVSKSPSSAPCPAQPKAAHSSPPSSPGSSSSSSSATPPPFLNPSCSPWPLPPPASPPHPSSPGQTPLPLSSALALMSCPSVLARGRCTRRVCCRRCATSWGGAGCSRRRTRRIGSGGRASWRRRTGWRARGWCARHAVVRSRVLCL
ncbi:hypothetical protein B0H21DRAFT_437190 [Amylocystis lapponica]|nr:hypothetical protein B0H21DRAFT_437190 [Amylocystis lapponica]